MTSHRSSATTWCRTPGPRPWPATRQGRRPAPAGQGTGRLGARAIPACGRWWSVPIGLFDRIVPAEGRPTLASSVRTLLGPLADHSRVGPPSSTDDDRTPSLRSAVLRTLGTIRSGPRRAERGGGVGSQSRATTPAPRRHGFRRARHCRRRRRRRRVRGLPGHSTGRPPRHRRRTASSTPARQLRRRRLSPPARSNWP